MVDVGYETNVGKTVVKGIPPFILERNVETATNMYPGRLVKQGTTGYDVAVHDALAPVVGILGYEHTSENYRKDAISTIYTAGDDAAVLRGSGFAATMKMAAGPTALQGDLAIPWSSGQVVPAVMVKGQLCVRVYFSKNVSQTDTNLDFPSGVVIGLPQILVTTAAGGATIDVGLGMGTESGYDADGLADGVSIAATGLRTHVMADTTSTNITSGALLEDGSDFKDANTGAVYTPILYNPGLVCDGTLVSLDYTTSSHTVAGYILVPVSSAGIQPVGRFVTGYSASASAQDCIIEVNL